MRWTTRPLFRSLARLTTATAILATVLTGVLAGTITPAAAATGSVPSFGSFGLTPAPAPDGQPQSYFTFAIRPGHRATGSVVATNLSVRSERLRLALSRGVTAANSGSAYENLTGRCTGPSCWVSGLPHIIVLAPGEQERIGFAVRVPRGVRRGQYLAGISLAAAASPRSVAAGKHGRSSARAIIIEEVTVGVAVTVGNPARLTSALRAGQVTAAWLGTTPRLTIPVTNTGETFLHAAGQLRCVSGGRARSYRVLMETVLPGGRAELAVNAFGLKSGSLPCQVQLRTDTGRTVRWSGRVRLATAVKATTYHPAKGVFLSVPEQTMPAWAVALIALGSLILLALVLLLVQRRRLSIRRAAHAR